MMGKSVWGFQERTNQGTIGMLRVWPVLAILAMLSGCGSTCSNSAIIDFTPVPGTDWQVAEPGDLGLDDALLANLYSRAGELETIHSLLVIKDGYLIAEKYFNGSSADSSERLQSVTKSVTGALVGIALREGFIDDPDDLLLDYFPEISPFITDERKREITVRQLLQMRSGFPWEESHADLWEGLLSGYYVPLIYQYPLADDPGSEFHYSNLSSNLLGIIIDTQSGMPLEDFAESYLFSALGIEPGSWGTDNEGHNNGCGDLHLTARDAALFGQLYLDEGVFDGRQVVPAAWVEDSFAVYSEDAWQYRVGKNFEDIGYGYQWWSIRSGSHRYNLAWGHGGQQIAVLRDLNMVVVLTAEPFWLEHTGNSWKHEKANLNLVANFVRSLPDVY